MIASIHLTAITDKVDKIQENTFLTVILTYYYTVYSGPFDWKISNLGKFVYAVNCDFRGLDVGQNSAIHLTKSAEDFAWLI